MADNKYCNLVPTNLISEEFEKINTGFDGVEEDINEANAKQAQGIDLLKARVDEIITTPISGEAAAQELVDARGGKDTLGDRFGDIDSQLAESTQDITNLRLSKTDKSYVDTLAQSLANGSPKGVYNTLADLQTAFPTGNNNIYVVKTDRNWYHWDGSSWVSGGLYQSDLSDDFPAANTVSNGKFANGTTGWDVTTGTLSATNNILSLTGNGAGDSAVARQNLNQTLQVGDVYYVSARVKVTNPNCLSIDSYLFNGSTAFYAKQLASPVADTLYKLNGLVTVTGSAPTQSRIYIRQTYADSATANGKVMEIQNVIVVNLTKTFGAGYEPTLAEFEEILSRFPNSWFDGTVSPLLGNKDLLLANKKMGNLNELLTGVKADLVKAINEVVGYSKNFLATNIPINSDFSNSTTNWLSGGTGTVISATNGEATVLAGSSYGAIRQTISVKANNKYYLKANVKATSSKVTLAMYDGLTVLYGNAHSGSGTYERLSSIFEINNTSPSGQIQPVRDARTSGWDNVYVKYVLCINLTETFGAGYEPTVEFMDSILSKYTNEWFDGTVSPLIETKEWVNGQINEVKSMLNGLDFLSPIDYIVNPSASDYTGQGMVTLSYDDGLLSNYRLALQLHEKHGIPATFNVIGLRVIDTSFHDRFFNPTIVSECNEKGIEIASHGYNHMVHMTEQTDEQIHYEMSQSKAVLEGIIGTTVDTIAIPFSFYDARVKAIAQQYFKGVRVSGNVLNDIPPTDRYEINSAIAVKNDTTFTQVKTLIDNAITDKKWCVIMLHGIKNAPLAECTTYQITPALLDQILAYIRQQGKENILPVNTKTALKIALGANY